MEMKNSEELLILAIEPDKTIDYTYNLSKNRIIFLNSELDQDTSNNIVTLLYLMNKDNPELPIELWLHSPGGDASGFMAIYDMMQLVNAPIKTVCIGGACSAAALLLSAGTKGMRFASENSRIMIHQLQLEGIGGSNTEVEINTKEIKILQDQLTTILARHTGHTKTKIRKDTKMDKYLSAQEAVEYGIIDGILPFAKKLPSLVEEVKPSKSNKKKIEKDSNE